jgi:hypothetical protein
MKRGKFDSRCKPCRNKKRRERYRHQSVESEELPDPTLDVVLTFMRGEPGCNNVIESILMKLALEILTEAPTLEYQSADSEAFETGIRPDSCFERAAG